MSLFISAALVISVVEAQIPFTGAVPGIKLGLANVVIFSVIIIYGLREALTVNFVRCLLQAIFVGGVGALWYSLPAGLASTCVMWVLRRKAGWNVVAASIVGAFVHVTVQVAVASGVVRSVGVFAGLPLLLIFSGITGGLVGVSTNYIVKIFSGYEKRDYT